MAIFPEPKNIQFLTMWGTGGKLDDTIWKLKCSKFLDASIV